MADTPDDFIFKKPRLDLKKVEKINSYTAGGKKSQDKIRSVVRETSSCHGTIASIRYPSLNDYFGPYGFSIEIGFFETTQTTYAQFSHSLHKIYITDGYCMPFKFRLNTPPPPPLPKNDSGYFIKAVVVYTNVGSISKPVLRCSNHMSNPVDPYKKYSDNVLISPNQNAIYEVDKDTHRRCVSLPFTTDKWEMYYMSCRNTCGGGMNGRPTAIIFSLEKQDKVYGRVVLNIDVSAAPIKAKEYEEKTASIRNRYLNSIYRNTHLMKHTPVTCSKIPRVREDRSLCNKCHKLTTGNAITCASCIYEMVRDEFTSREHKLILLREARSMLQNILPEGGEKQSVLIRYDKQILGFEKSARTAYEALLVLNMAPGFEQVAKYTRTLSTTTTSANASSRPANSATASTNKAVTATVTSETVTTGTKTETSITLASATGSSTTVMNNIDTPEKRASFYKSATEQLLIMYRTKVEREMPDGEEKIAKLLDCDEKIDTLSSVIIPTITSDL